MSPQYAIDLVTSEVPQLAVELFLDIFHIRNNKTCLAKHFTAPHQGLDIGTMFAESPELAVDVFALQFQWMNLLDSRS